MKSQEPTVLLISIHEEYAEQIFSERKTVELRKVRPKKLKCGDIVVVYVTSPQKRIQGVFEVEKIVENSPKNLWSEVKAKAGIKKEDFDSYYNQISLGVAIYIKKVFVFPNPIKLQDIQKKWVDFRPPQSYRYVTREQVNLLESFLDLNILNSMNPPQSKQLSLNL